MTLRSLRSNDRLRFSPPFEIGLKTSHPYLSVPATPPLRLNQIVVHILFRMGPLSEEKSPSAARLTSTI
jgi:hypothetical protein